MLCTMNFTFVHGFCLMAVLGLWISSTSAIEISLIPSNPKVNGDVTLKVTGINGTIRSYSWYEGNSPSASSQILNYIPTLPDPETKGNRYFPEARGLPNGSLSIIQLRKEFEGNYTVQIQSNVLQQETILLSLNGVGSFGLSMPFYILLIISLAVAFP